MESSGREYIQKQAGIYNKMEEEMNEIDYSNKNKWKKFVEDCTSH
jgi:hypothetical protein